MNIKKPLFSIITVTYNASKELERTIKSISEQNFHDYEWIVVDGASKDNTLEIVEASGIEPRRVYSEPDSGLYDAMNKGIGYANGEYLIFLNAGDAFYNHDTLHVIADTAKRTHADVVYGQTQIVDADGKVIGMRHLTAPSVLKFSSFKRGMVVCHQAFVARKRIAQPYDLKYRFSSDFEWCLRCLKQSKRNAYTGGTLISFLDGGTTTQNHRASLGERFRIMCRYYGPITTVIRHIGFIPRYLARQSGL